jgi:hypothetical protein
MGWDGLRGEVEWQGIDWFSKKQKLVATSTVEAEYMAITSS